MNPNNSLRPGASDEPPANAWPLLLAGLASSALAALLLRADAAAGFRLAFLGAGLPATAGAVVLRPRSAGALSLVLRIGVDGEELHAFRGIVLVRLGHAQPGGQARTNISDKRVAG